MWGVLWLVLWLWSFVSSSQPYDPLQGLARAGHPLVFVIVLIVGVALFPVAEEVFCRGFIYNALRRHVAAPFAIILQALAFALWHPYSLGYMVAAFFLGLYLATIYNWRKTLYAPICVHSLNNLGASVVTVLAALQAGNTPVLGIQGEAGPQGCRVTAVAPGRAAEKVGIRQGDVITAIDGQPIASFEDVRQMTRQRRVGDRVVVSVLRDQIPLTFEAELGPLRAD
jgi:Type II CAAX prenyl endopeptidase Rce1-like/PDZ domain